MHGLAGEGLFFFFFFFEINLIVSMHSKIIDNFIITKTSFLTKRHALFFEKIYFVSLFTTEPLSLVNGRRIKRLLAPILRFLSHRSRVIGPFHLVLCRQYSCPGLARGATASGGAAC